MTNTTPLLSEDPLTGTVIVPHGATFADLFGAWERQHAYVHHLLEICDKPNETEEEQALCQCEISKQRHLEQALYAASTTIEAAEELLMLAKVDMSFEGSSHDHPECLARSVIRILGKLADAPQLIPEGEIAQ
jgi:hypothetical protein